MAKTSYHIYILIQLCVVNTVAQNTKPKNRPTHVISVISADKPRGGDVGIIHVTLLSGNKAGIEKTLRVPSFPHDFERGHVNKFKIYEPEILVVDGIVIRGDAILGNEGWNIDKITSKSDNGGTVVIPIFTMIGGGSTETFMVNDIALPQHVSRKKRSTRQEELEKARQLYKFGLEPYGVPLVEVLPPQEDPQGRGGTLLFLETEALKTFENVSFIKFRDIKRVFENPYFTEPLSFTRWKDDVAFGLQRLAGVNSMAISLCKQIPHNLVLTRKDKSRIRKYIGMKLTDAIMARRVFVVDYAILENITTNVGHKVPAPIALFFQNGSGVLLPIAIQLYQQPCPHNPVFFPTDSKFVWILVKMWFNVADAAYHQAVTHYGFTHLITDGLVAITHRQLHKTHPLYKLLLPHFLYNLYLNRRGIVVLLTPGTYIDRAMGIGSYGTIELMQRKYPHWQLNVDGNIRKELRNRGVLDPDLLPHYYYRDDGIRLYDAIHRYVSEYVNHYYKDRHAVLNDVELQAWRHELTSELDQGGLGMSETPGKNGKFTNTDQVSRVITNIIFTSSAQHAAVNFRQYDQYAYAPNYPAILHGSPPTTKKRLFRRDLLQYMPNQDNLVSMFAMATVLSKRRFNQLGDFEVAYVTDPDGLKIVENFRNDLARLAEEMEGEVHNRLLPYDPLNPKLVPNSASA